MHLPSLQQLRYLVALADELHFGRAAAVCNVTQSTLSNGIKELETDLGVALAERTRRSVLMTGAGLEIAERARKLLADASDLADAAKHQSGHLRGGLRVGVIPTIGPFLLPPSLPILKQRFPELKVYLREELSDSLLEGLKSARLDVILIALPFDIEDLSYCSLFEDEFVLTCPNSHSLANASSVTGNRLAGERLMLLEKGHCLQTHALSAFDNVVIEQDESFAATSLLTLVSMVELGLGVTLLPKLAVDAGITRGAQVSVSTLEGARSREVILAWRKTSARAQEFQALGEVFRQAWLGLG
jgi:LysR family hydrogen peroxide-inducible transcriptional activator